MVFHYLRHAALAATLLHQTIAQRSSIVPEDLRGGFSSGTEIQASYTGEAVNGFKDGTSFEKDAVSKEPTFALGDSSGISPTTLHTIIMVDTTCPGKRVLHYARANFKNNFDITNIDTESAALQEYKAPGSFGETGDNRQYSFLMYINPQRKQIDSLQLPAEGEAFDVEKFQTDNGLPDAFGGVGMVVKLGGGQADCGGDQPNQVPDTQPSARPSPSSTANAAPTSSAAVATSSTRAAPSSTSARQPVSSAANAPPTPSSPPSSPNNPSNGNSSAPARPSAAPNAPGPSAGPNAPSPAGPTSGLVAASSAAAPPAGLATSTIVNSPNGAVGASGTPSASLAQQTVNAAPGLSVSGLGPLAPLFAVVGLLVW